MKSLAHPEWPYVGTPWEWKGFAEKAAEREPRPAGTVPLSDAKVAALSRNYERTHGH